MKSRGRRLTFDCIDRRKLSVLKIKRNILNKLTCEDPVCEDFPLPSKTPLQRLSMQKLASTKTRLFEDSPLRRLASAKTRLCEDSPLRRLASAKTRRCEDSPLRRLASAKTRLCEDSPLRRLASAKTRLCEDLPLRRLVSAKTRLCEDFLTHLESQNCQRSGIKHNLDSSPGQNLDYLIRDWFSSQTHRGQRCCSQTISTEWQFGRINH
jgi:hypothetical protein